MYMPGRRGEGSSTSSAQVRCLNGVAGLTKEKRARAVIRVLSKRAAKAAVVSLPVGGRAKRSVSEKEYASGTGAVGGDGAAARAYVGGEDG